MALLSLLRSCRMNISISIIARLPVVNAAGRSWYFDSFNQWWGFCVDPTWVSPSQVRQAANGWRSPDGVHGTPMYSHVLPWFPSRIPFPKASPRQPIAFRKWKAAGSCWFLGSDGLITFSVEGLLRAAEKQNTPCEFAGFCCSGVAQLQWNGSSSLIRNGFNGLNLKETLATIGCFSK